MSPSVPENPNVYDSLWPRVVEPRNIWNAWKRASKGKRRRPNVAAFGISLEPELIALRNELVNGSYQPGGYRHFTVHDGKPRHISAAPFRDRVVHHALMQVVDPIFENLFLPNSWACRTGKGTHAAVRTYQRWARRYTYALKVDVAKYFASIDHMRLQRKLRAVLDDADVLALFDRILASYETAPGRGLPLGNLTSQVLGNLYLHDVDILVTRAWGYRAYLRYVDDLIVLGDDKTRLWGLCDAINEHLAHDGLHLHPKKILLTPTTNGLDVLGYRVFPRHIRLRHGNGHRAQRRLAGRAALVRQGALTPENLEATLQSWLGHARHAQTQGLRRAVLSAMMRPMGVRDSSSIARRGLDLGT